MCIYRAVRKTTTPKITNKIAFTIMLYFNFVFILFSVSTKIEIFRRNMATGATEVDKKSEAHSRSAVRLADVII